MKIDRVIKNNTFAEFDCWKSKVLKYIPNNLTVAGPKDGRIIKNVE
jgi:hypothetical protein